MSSVQARSRLPENMRDLRWGAVGTSRTVPGFHAGMLCVVLLTLLSNLLDGCGPVVGCQPGQGRCEGLVAENCQATETGNGTSYTWSHDDCSGGATCVIVHESNADLALCALDDSPNVLCGNDYQTCNGSTITNCEEGYATWTYDCATGASAGKIAADLRGTSGPACRSDAALKVSSCVAE
jgi:hypothetical protein